jgi:hypothetical protein
VSPAGNKILPFPIFRRSEQIGIIQRNFPGRWLALLLMGSVGAAWALNPAPGEALAPVLPASKMVVEGEPQVIAQLMGSLVGEVAMSQEDRGLLGAADRRVVLQSKLVPGNPLQAQREKAEFLRTVEEVEAEYLVGGRYPALPQASEGAVVSYRTDGEDFTLSSGHRRYTAAQGMTYGAPPASGVEFEVKGFLSPEAGGWGPWRKEGVALEAKPGVESTEDLDFLKELPLVARGSARMFFPVDRANCGYLFRRIDGSTAYSAGELTYDSVNGNFSVKLFRPGDAARQSLNPDSLESELANRDGAVAMVGEASLLADLGFVSAPKQGEEVVVVSSSALLPCSVTSALDGLRLASLDKHKEVLAAGQLAAAPDSAAKATVVARVQMQDKLGQLHQLRMRAGRGANYDWIVGQVCPLADVAQVPGFVDSQAASYEDPIPAEQRLVKAGQ